MPLTVQFVKNILTHSKDLSIKDIRIYWYHRDFTQSRFPPGQKDSKACTLICLLVAQRVCESELFLRSSKDRNAFVILIAKSIVEGNKRHSQIIKQGLTSHPYLSIYEAYSFGGNRLKSLKEWKFKIFSDDIETKLHINIQSFLSEWYKGPITDTLTMFLIASGRTVLFIFQKKIDKITLFDSHSHKTVENLYRGLVVAQVSFKNLNCLCDWYVNAILRGSSRNAIDRYELTFLYNCKPKCDSKTAQCK